MNVCEALLLDSTIYQSGPEKESVEEADEAEEHGRIHVVLVINLPTEQHDIRGVKEGAKQCPVVINKLPLSKKPKTFQII